MCYNVSCQNFAIIAFPHNLTITQKNASEIVLGGALNVTISWTLTQFPRPVLEIANLGQNVILYLSIVKHLKVHYLYLSLFK